MVVTANPRDLNELLVSSGLARFYGTRASLPDGRYNSVAHRLAGTV